MYFIVQSIASLSINSRAEGVIPLIKIAETASHAFSAEVNGTSNVISLVGRGISLKDVAGGRKSTTYEFSTSNPLWRASLETIDFMPLSSANAIGGTIITDWYTNENDTNSSIKITVRFLSNEITSTSLKIIVHQK